MWKLRKNRHPRLRNIKSLLARNVKWLRNFFAIFQDNYEVVIYEKILSS